MDESEMSFVLVAEVSVINTLALVMESIRKYSAVAFNYHLKLGC